MWEKIRKLELQKDASLGAKKEATPNGDSRTETSKGSEKVAIKKETGSGNDSSEDDDSDLDEDDPNDFRFKGGVRR